jgi:TolB protein
MALVVMPFSSDTASTWTGDLPQTLRDLIEKDLATCGYFNILDPAPYAADTASLFLTLPNQPPRVIGNVEAGWSAVTANVGITQPPVPTPIHMREFRFVSDELRSNAHRIAAWITKMLTGEDGAFTSRVAFVARQSRDKHLWVMDWDGASPQALTQDGEINISPHWTPDGSHLFFTSFRRGNADIYRYDLVTGRISVAVSGPGVDSAPAVSADGEWVAFSSSVDGNAEIFRMRPDGTQRTRLTVSWGIDTSPTWSPTGREIAFTSDRSGSPQIWRMDFDGGSVRRISFVGDYNDSPAWSPRGDLIAYAGRNGDFQIVTMTPEGTNLRQLTSPPGASYDPAWSPDGMKIAFTSTRGGSEAVWVMNWDGSDPHKLTSGLAAMAPQWGPIEAVK